MRCFAIYKQKNTLKVCQCHNKYVLLQPLTSKRDLAQLVAHASGGREVAGSSPVIPTTCKRKAVNIRVYRYLRLFFMVFPVKGKHKGETSNI